VVRWAVKLLLILLATACGRAAEPPAPPLIAADHSTGNPVIAQRAASEQGPALLLTRKGALYRVADKLERIATGIVCVEAIADRAVAVGDGAIWHVEAELKRVGNAPRDLTACTVTSRGDVIAQGPNGLSRLTTTGATAIAVPPTRLETFGVDDLDRIIGSAGDQLYVFDGAAWHGLFRSVVLGNTSALVAILRAPGGAVTVDQFGSSSLIAGNRAKSFYVSNGLRSMHPDAVGMGVDGTLWAANFETVTIVAAGQEHNRPKVRFGFAGGVPTAITGDGRGRGWVTTNVSLAVLDMFPGAMVAEWSLEPLGGDPVARIVVVRGGPETLAASERPAWTGVVRGHVRVRDEVVPGAQVTLCVDHKPMGTCTTRYQGVTDDDGAYEIRGVPPTDMRMVVVAGDSELQPHGAPCCGLLKRDQPYKLDADLADSIGVDFKPTCPARPRPCKIPGVESRPARRAR